MLARRWKKLDLDDVPGKHDDAVHGSSSPLASLLERMNWLRLQPEQDAWGEYLLNHVGVSRTRLESWATNPRLRDPSDRASGFHHILDLVDGMNADSCLAKCREIARQPTEQDPDSHYAPPGPTS